MKSLFSLLVLLFISFIIKAQNADDVIGTWKNGEGTGIIQIYKTTSGHYAGKIIWLKEPIDTETGKAKLDKRNPDKTKRTVPTLGLVNMRNFKFDEDDKVWENGKIYDPKNGKEYSCKMQFAKGNKDKLEVRGYVGISLLGRTDTWTRQPKQ
jgi:uncharacterized protein (DUF2147 family)